MVRFPFDLIEFYIFLNLSPKGTTWLGRMTEITASCTLTVRCGLPSDSRAQFFIQIASLQLAQRMRVTSPCELVAWAWNVVDPNMEGIHVSVFVFVCEQVQSRGW